MKPGSWQDCLEERNALKVSIDEERAKSLIETSEERISIINEVNNKNCNFVFEDYYTSVLEMIQAMVILKGFKVTNHLCLGFYLRDVLKRNDLFIMFDDLRYKRNALTYYGNKMDFETGIAAIEMAKELLNELKRIMKERSKLVHRGS